MKQLLLLIAILWVSADWANAGWIRRSDFGSVGRHRGTGCAAGNRGYFGLGHYNGTGTNVVKKDWWEYDPATNAWAQRADFVGNNGNGNYAVLAFGIGDYAYITGGTFSDLNTYRYSPATNTWDIVATAPSLFSNTEGFVLGNKGYVLKGTDFYEFDASTSQWTLKNPAPFNSSTWMGAFSIGEKGYMRTSSGFYEYKPTTDSWIMRAYFPGLATAASMNFSQDGKGYVLCGYAGWLSEVNSEVWQYDPLLNAWEQLEDFPGTSRRFGSSFSIGNRSFVGIGTNGTNFNDFWEFDADLYLNIPYLDAATINVYPNPVVEQVTIDLTGLPTFDVQLYDGTGKLVRQANTCSGSCTLLRESLPSGSYSVRILVNGTVLETKKLILN